MIFTIVDVVDSDGFYFTLGYFDDINEALTELHKHIDKNAPISYTGEETRFERIEIRKHNIGWGEDFEVVYKVERERKWVDDDDEDDTWVNNVVLNNLAANHG